MESNSTHKTNYIQMTGTILLLLLLLAIVAGYIYFGMLQAQIQSPSEVTEATPTIASDAPLTTEAKLKILHDLSVQSNSETDSPATADEKEAQLNKLTTESTETAAVPHEEKIKMLQALSTP